MEYNYFFYHHGDYEFGELVEDIIKVKNFELFMKVYQWDKEGRLPETIWVDNGENEEVTEVSILDKENFMKITHSEYEWG
jgi:hypothetical protein